MSGWNLPLLAMGAGAGAVMSSMKENWEKIVAFLIRPPRHEYALDHLGPEKFQCAGGSECPTFVYTRKDLELVNPRGLTLQASFWSPENSTERPCVIYLHSSGGSRLEAVDLLPTMVNLRYSIFAMDFSGSGKSEGEYITLGSMEQQDICSAMEYLKSSTKSTEVILWGRSMGATSALLYTSRDSSVSGMVLDTPYASLPKLLEHVCRTLVPWMPCAAVKLGMHAVAESIKDRAMFDVYSLDLVAKENGTSVVGRCRVPAIFGYGFQDKIVTQDHVESILAGYGGCLKRSMIAFEGDHVSPRPDAFKASVEDFMSRHFGAGPALKQQQQQQQQQQPDFENIFAKVISGQGDPSDISTLSTAPSRACPENSIRVSSERLMTVSFLLNLSHCHIKTKNFKTGFQYAFSAVALDPHNPKGYYRCAVALVELGDVLEAGYFAARAVDLKGGVAAKKLLNEICVGECLCSPEEAVQNTSCYISKVPSFGQVSPIPLQQVKDKGNLEVKNGLFYKAIDTYSVGLQASSCLASPLTSRASRHIHAKDAVLGLFDATAAFTLDPEAPDPHTRRTQGFLCLNQIAVASVSVELGLALHPDDQGLVNIAQKVRVLAGASA